MPNASPSEFMPNSSCPLCNSPRTSLFFENPSERFNQAYYHCNNCRLVFVAPETLPSKEEEKSRYDTHENDPNDTGYRNFLSQLFDPLQARLEPGSLGLDFGSGPGPTLNLMFEEKGHSMQIYDPFYRDDSSVWETDYDFITATEVAEHLHYPAKEFNQLWDSLRPNGYLGLMTKLADDFLTPETFANWHYRRDLTHVSFYSRYTFEWLAEQWNADLTFYGDRVIILQKSDS